MPRWPLAVLAGLLTTSSAVAEPDPVEAIRVLTDPQLDTLKYCVELGRVKFDTAELNSRLDRRKAASGTRSLLLTAAGPGGADAVWYTDWASTTPRRIGVTRADHTVLTQIAASGVMQAFTLTETRRTVSEQVLVTVPVVKTVATTVTVMTLAGPRTVTQNVPVTEHAIQTQVVTRVVSIPPPADRLDAAVAALDRATDPVARRTLELMLGARLAELLPPGVVLPGAERATAIANRYREETLKDARAFYMAAAPNALPPLGEPQLFGTTDKDAVALARAVNGAKPSATFEVGPDRFAAVWDRAALAVVRVPGRVAPADDVVRLSEEWLRILDPARKIPAKPIEFPRTGLLRSP